MQLISTINQFWQEFLAVALLAFIAGALAGWYIKSLCCLDEPKGSHRARSKSRRPRPSDLQSIIVDVGATGAGQTKRATSKLSGETQYYTSPSTKLICQHVYDKMCNVQPPFRCRGPGLCNHTHPKEGEPKTCELAIVQCLMSAKVSIDLCIYRLIYQNFTNILIAMKRKGVRVRVVTDQSTKNDQEDIKRHNQELARLNDSQIEIRTPRDINEKQQQGKHTGLMHNKYVLVDSIKFLGGSMNWSKGALMHNHELLTYETNQNNVKQLMHNFEQLWTNSTRVVEFKRETS